MGLSCLSRSLSSGL